METLHPTEVRVLGALVEKEITTPEYYPLTLNALVNACNQKSSREPVVSYGEDTVSQALVQLRNKGLGLRISGAGHRYRAWFFRYDVWIESRRGQHVGDRASASYHAWRRDVVGDGRQRSAIPGRVKLRITRPDKLRYSK